MNQSNTLYVINELTAILNGKLSADTVMIALHHGVLAMQRFRRLRGAEKKQVLCAALTELAARAACARTHDVLLMVMSDGIDSLVAMRRCKRGPICGDDPA